MSADTKIALIEFALGVCIGIAMVVPAYFLTDWVAGVLA